MTTHFKRVLTAGFALLLAASPSPTHAQNLVQNPSFETGDFTGWTTTPAVSDSLFAVYNITAHSGSRSAGFGAPGGFDDMISQTLPTVNGEQYLFSFWVDNSHSFGGTSFTADWGGSPVLTLTPASPQTSWTQYEFTETATGPTTIDFAGQNLFGYVYLDQVSVTSTTTVPDSALGTPLVALVLFGLCAMSRVRQFRAA